MADDLEEKFQKVREMYNDRFRSRTAAQRNDEYINRLYEEMKRWRSASNDFLHTVVDEKRYELKALYERYLREMDDKYQRLKAQVQSQRPSSDVNEQIDEFNMFCQASTIENRIRLYRSEFPKHQLTDKLELEYKPYHAVIPEAPIAPINPIGQQPRRPSYSSQRSPSSEFTPREEPVNNIPGRETPRKEPVEKPATVPADEELTGPITDPPPPSTLPPETTTSTADPPKRSAQLYVGKQIVFTPILVDENRQKANETPPAVEYVIDSVDMQPHQQVPSSNGNNENDDDTLVAKYKGLIQGENSNRQRLTSADDPPSGSQSRPTNRFNLQQLNQIDYSTVMFQKCETQYNCMASSTKRNELVVYNSKLKVLIIIQHEHHQACRHRFYLQWPDEFSPNISDITYCEENEEYLIATWDTSHIYSFDRKEVSVNDLGSIPQDLPLRRIHCHRRTVYCILSNNYLLEYQFDDQCSQLTLVDERIKLFNPEVRSQDTAYQLLDVACNDEYLAVAYVFDRDIIRLQVIHRQSRRFHCDLALDTVETINRSYIRLEPVIHQRSFIYVNGLQYHLKAIDFDTDANGKVTPTVCRFTKPTNSCFLADGRFAILYEEPYYLSVHETHDRSGMSDS